MALDPLGDGRKRRTFGSRKYPFVQTQRKRFAMLSRLEGAGRKWRPSDAPIRPVDSGHGEHDRAVENRTWRSLVRSTPPNFTSRAPQRRNRHRGQARTRRRLLVKRMEKAAFLHDFHFGRPTQDQVCSLSYLSTAEWNETRFVREDFDKLIRGARFFRYERKCITTRL